MKQTTPINSIYLIALAVASVVIKIYSLYTAVLFGIVVGAVFLISLSIVSMIDKISDNHIRYVMYALVCAVLISIVKVCLGYFQNPTILFLASTVEYAILPALIMGIYPIYFENTLSTKKYFVQIISMALIWLIFALLYGIIIGVLGYGAIGPYSIGFEGIDFFTYSYGGFFVIGTLALIMNMIRRAIIKHNARVNNLVEKYKTVIYSIKRIEKVQHIVDEEEEKK